MPFQSNDEIQFQCRHILTDGRRCKNPTLRSPRTEENPQGHENFCYFHHTTRGAASMTRKPRAPHSPEASSGMVAERSTFTLPLLEDRSSIQLAISQVLQQIASNELDPRRAGLLLYGLQVASLNLPKSHPKQESEPTTTVSEITHDPILGVLAPPAELGHDEPKSSIHLLLEHVDRLDSIQAVADPTHHPRIEPSSTTASGAKQPSTDLLCAFPIPGLPFVVPRNSSPEISKMNVRTFLPVALGLATFSLGAVAQHPRAPVPSHWKLNVPASDFGGTPPLKAGSTTLTADSETNLRWRHTETDNKGTISGLWVGAYDGKPRPVTGIKGEMFSIQPDGTFHIDESNGTTIDGTIITADDLKSYTETATVKTSDGQEHHLKLVYDRVK